jgi:glycosyltransferase involved in cell wall biosynthesis
MKRVLVIANNLAQASYRLRIAALIEPLRQRGVEFDVRVRPREKGARRKLFASAADFDAVILQRKLLDSGEARLLAGAARRLFYDVDDAVMYDNPTAGWWARRRAWRRFTATAANVDHVVAGNNYLAEMFRKEGATVSVLPTVVDVSRYQVKEHADAKPLTLVWIGSRSTLAYLEEIMPQLSDASRKIGGLKLLVIADAAPQATDGVDVELVPWSVDSEAQALCRADVGIAPTPTDRWTLGKCGFKIVQYMAAGLPTIASPVGANAELVVENQTGFLPRLPSEWPQAIASLMDYGLRTRMGAVARQRACEFYSLTRAVEFWRRLVQES